jgi:eukaryotic-like serine/threonine-protein kinase
MSFFTNLRADRLIFQIKSSTDLMSEPTQKAIAKLKEMGPASSRWCIAALPDADKHCTVAFVDVLSTLVSAKTFPRFAEAWSRAARG